MIVESPSIIYGCLGWVGTNYEKLTLDWKLVANNPGEPSSISDPILM